VGQACANDFDCDGNLVCDPYTDTCQEGCLAENEECYAAEDCCDPLVCAPNPLVGVITETYCIQCFEDGSGCFDDRQCCSGVCDEYSGTCGGLTDSAVGWVAWPA
jgi:hypothetical protein